MALSKISNKPPVPHALLHATVGPLKQGPAITPTGTSHGLTGLKLVASAATALVCVAAHPGQRRMRRRRVCLKQQIRETESLGMYLPTDPALEDPALFGNGMYSHRDWCSAFRTAVPCDLVDCEIEGELPKELQGTLFRNGPGRFERGGNKYAHFLDGDGFISAWELKNGHCRYRGDFVRTEEYCKEDAEECLLYRGPFGTLKPGGPLANAGDVRMKNLANTNVVEWGGKLLALFEAGHPCKVEAGNLSFMGCDDLEGCLTPGFAASSGLDRMDEFLGMGGSAFTAHPKMDPRRRSLVGFRWASRPGGIDMHIHEWDESFKQLPEIPEEGIKLPMPNCHAQPHDFGVSDKFYVFIENRLQMGSMTSFLLGQKGVAECLHTLPKFPQRIHIVPRPGDMEGEQAQAITTVQGSASAFDVHVAHCHDGPPPGWQGDQSSDDLVTIYTTSWDELPEGQFLSAWGGQNKEWPFELPADAVTSDFNDIPPARLLRHVIDVRKGEIADRSVTPGCENFCLEHPVINCSYTGNPNLRNIYFVICNENGQSSPPCGWGKVDLKTGEAKRWYAGSRCVVEEPHFVPRSGPQGTWTPGEPVGEEGDGWLLGAMYDAAKDRTCLCVLDPTRLEEGPVCKVWLPHAVPRSLHGSFVPSFCAP